MATYYVGPGGSDGNSGATWALRKLTLNGAEDIPVAANDTVYVGPGTYYEALTMDVSGSSGQPITYIGDVTGENTDGVGGVVRISGLDSANQTLTRSNCVNNGASRSYRTFRGFWMGGSSAYIFTNSNWTTDNFIIEDCYFSDATQASIALVNASITNTTIRRCIFDATLQSQSMIWIAHSSTVDNTNNLIENCAFIGNQYHVRTDRLGGITVKNCVFYSCAGVAVRTFNSPSAGQTLNVNNCIILHCNIGMQAPESDDITEDYNTFYANATDRNVVATGSNSVSYPAHYDIGPKIEAILRPLKFYSISPDSAVAQITGTSQSSDDLYGTSRPATASKISWGPVQVEFSGRDTTNTRGSSTAALILSDASSRQFRLPVTATSTTVSVYVYREASYAGTLPQMVIREPGQTARTTTDTGAASQYNQLSDTFTPQSTSDFVIVELVSNNTATSGSYAVYFEDLVAL